MGVPYRMKGDRFHVGSSYDAIPGSPEGLRVDGLAIGEGEHKLRVCTEQFVLVTLDILPVVQLGDRRSVERNGPDRSPGLWTAERHLVTIERSSLADEKASAVVVDVGPPQSNQLATA